MYQEQSQGLESSMACDYVVSGSVPIFPETCGRAHGPLGLSPRVAQWHSPVFTSVHVRDRNMDTGCRECGLVVF